MSRLPKRMQQAKRVAPPAVPEIYHNIRHSGSSFGSAGYGSCDDTSNMGGGSNFYATNDPNSSLNVSLRSNTSNSSIDVPDNATSRLLQANPPTNAAGMLYAFPTQTKYSKIVRKNNERSKKNVEKICEKSQEKNYAKNGE